MAAGDPSEWEAVTSFLQGSSHLTKAFAVLDSEGSAKPRFFKVLCNTTGEAERRCKNMWRDARRLGVYL